MVSDHLPIAKLMSQILGPINKGHSLRRSASHAYFSLKRAPAHMLIRRVDVLAVYA